MNAKQFYKKWEIKHHNVHHYKKIFPQFVFDNEINYSMLDKEFARRTNLKEYARLTLFEARGLDIHECFTKPNDKEKACNWLVRLYMQPVCEKSAKKLIETRTVIRIRKILKHYKKVNKCKDLAQREE